LATMRIVSSLVNFEIEIFVELASSVAKKSPLVSFVKGGVCFPSTRVVPVFEKHALSLVEGRDQGRFELTKLKGEIL
jgi:hypothetical protein